MAAYVNSQSLVPSRFSNGSWPVMGVMAVFGALAASAFMRPERKRDKRSLKRTVLITGGARGLGLVMAREYASRDFNVVICSRTPLELERAKLDIESKYPDVTVTMRVCDVSDCYQVQSLIEDVVHRFGGIDVLVNNAGVIQVGPYLSMNDRDFDDTMNSNFWGTVHTCEFVIPYMKANGGGRILNVTSIGAVVPTPHLIPYAASKFAAFGFSTTLASEVKRYGISVTTAVPGLMRTGSFLKILLKGQRDKEFRWFAFAANSPLTAMRPERAAVSMINACERGVPVCVPGLMAKFERLAFALFPNVFISILDRVNRVLPKAPKGFGRSEPGYLPGSLRDELPQGLYKTLGEKAARKNNETRAA